jgi:hypothetical protein
MSEVGQTDAYELGEGKVVTFRAHDLGEDFKDVVVAKTNITREHNRASQDFLKELMVNFIMGEERPQSIPGKYSQHQARVRRENILLSLGKIWAMVGSHDGAQAVQDIWNRERLKEIK